MQVAALLALASIAILMLAGCAGGFGLTKTADISALTIVWDRQEPSDCGGVKNAAGCAARDAAKCTITMPENSPDWIVAHEFRHCFGYVHE